MILRNPYPWSSRYSGVHMNCDRILYILIWFWLFIWLNLLLKRCCRSISPWSMEKGNGNGNNASANGEWSLPFVLFSCKHERNTADGIVLSEYVLFGVKFKAPWSTVPSPCSGGKIWIQKWGFICNLQFYRKCYREKVRCFTIFKIIQWEKDTQAI